MTELKNPLSFLIQSFVMSSFFRSFVYLLVEFQEFYYDRILWFNHTKEEEEEEIRDDESCSSSSSKMHYYCKSCEKNEGLLMKEDIDIVLEKLGIMSNSTTYNYDEEYDGNKCRCCRLFNDTCVLLDEKEATMDELEEAFAVFDKDGEGYIDGRKLQAVLRKLGLKEGMRLKDCEKMISAFDENGDGKIDLFEFRKLLESVE